MSEFPRHEHSTSLIPEKSASQILKESKELYQELLAVYGEKGLSRELSYRGVEADLAHNWLKLGKEGYSANLRERIHKILGLIKTEMPAGVASKAKGKAGETKEKKKPPSPEQLEAYLVKVLEHLKTKYDGEFTNEESGVRQRYLDMLADRNLLVRKRGKEGFVFYRVPKETKR